MQPFKPTHPIHYGLFVFSLFFFFLLQSISSVCQAPKVEKTPEQVHIDSLLNTAWGTARSQPRQSISNLEEIESINAKMVEPHKVDVVLYYYGIFHKNLNQFDESENYFNQYEAYQEKRGNKRNLAAVYSVKANLYSDQGHYAKSMEAVSKALVMNEELEDTLGIIGAGSKLGYLLSEVGRYDEALEYHRQSRQLALLAGLENEMEIAYTNIALVHEKREYLDSALFYYSRAYELGEKDGDAYSRVLNRYNMANIYQRMKDPEASSPYVIACMNLADSIDNPALRSASRRLLADLWIQQGKYADSILLLDSLKLDTTAYFGLRDRKDVYSLLSEAHKLNGDFVRAFENLEIYKSISDSLLGLDSQNRLNELEVQYETAKQKQKIEMLDLESQTSQAMILQKDRTILFGGIGLVLVTLLSLILYLFIRKYLLQKRVLAIALTDKDLLLREIHHRVKNNLQIVSSLLSLQGRSISDETALQAINEGKSRVRSMALIHQNLYQRENLTGVNVQDYMTKLVQELFQTYKVDEDQIGLETNIEALELDVDTLVPLGLIVNELIPNPLKYACPEGKQGTLIISLKQVDDKMVLEVRDDGIGYEPNDIHPNSFGQKMIGSLVKQLGGTMEADTTSGTYVKLVFTKFNTTK